MPAQLLMHQRGHLKVEEVHRLFGHFDNNHPNAARLETFRHFQANETRAHQ